MPSLKSIRTRISSVKSTQKITRAMKMVAGARLNRAQQRITELRPYAQKTQQVLSEVTESARRGERARAEERGEDATVTVANDRPLLAVRPERNVMLVVLTSDRGLCGSFNTNINKRAEHEWRRRTAEGQTVELVVIGRKGRDYFARRKAPMDFVPHGWDNLGWDSARQLGRAILRPFLLPDPATGRRVDAIYFVYNEFKSAMTQRVVVERLLPVADKHAEGEAQDIADAADVVSRQFIFEPNEDALLAELVPMYVQVSILRALYESMASELGARMTAMDSATRNAAEMIASLTLQYNRARQAAITKELMEIIGGSEALKA